MGLFIGEFVEFVEFVEFECNTCACRLWERRTGEFQKHVFLLLAVFVVAVISSDRVLLHTSTTYTSQFRRW